MMDALLALGSRSPWRGISTTHMRPIGTRQFGAGFYAAGMNFSPRLLGLILFPTVALSEPVKDYPSEIAEITYPVPEDSSEQPALFWKPELRKGETAPLLVALHTWSGNHRQAGGETAYAKWCLANDWIFIHPNFRGPNKTPEAMGSDLVIADIRAAVEWAKANAPVNDSRIYAIGVSGGGHASLLVAGRLSEIWAGVSAWCGISDIAAWHQQTSESGRGKYAENIEAALGGPPLPQSPELEDARHRSPLTWLEQAAEVPLDIAHGIHDGRTGSVPFTHSLRAWNAVVPDENRIPEDSIDTFYQTQQFPGAERTPQEDPLFRGREIHFREQHENTRVTVFEGGHEIVHHAALNWLAAQRKGEPTDWDPPLFSELKTSEEDSESGK